MAKQNGHHWHFFQESKKKVPKTSTSKNAHENDQRFWKMALDLD